MKTKLILASLLASNLIAGAADFVAHEWGTFTSVHAADGTQLEWNPGTAVDLPKFVYDRMRPTPDRPAPDLTDLLGKSTLLSLVRMETPVIYFYSDRERTVDVDVQFPQGIVTEWYPQTTPTTNRHTRWEKVAILPQLADASVLPNDGSKTHYYAARETDGAIIRAPVSKKQVEHEKFLFYRGVGSCGVPLQVRMTGNEEYVVLQNSENQELSHLFVLSVRGKAGDFVHLRGLRKDDTKQIKVPRGERSISQLQDDLAKAMREALTGEGLYAREAAAMVETWRDSWFGEEGLRVLYILPRQWSDRTLPLSIKPAPQKLARVMVGRAEVITPTKEWQLMKQIVKFSEGEQGAVGRFDQLGLGRFADAAVRRLLGRVPNQEFDGAAWGLLNVSRQQALKEAKLAAK
ncbi:MAG TPA: hypothetical protein VK615_11640 [Candidatus Binatia bacterium]|nr:hypothetical protein [Candidatus Binatia bacterium]